MEAERTVASCSPDFIVRPTAEQPLSTNKCHSIVSDACFDCNICLEFAANPVVTLCGHLYCWPCIFRWLNVDAAGPRHCPVCKSSISESSLVPLYGCGVESKPNPQGSDFPERPQGHKKISAAPALTGLHLSPPSRHVFQMNQNYYSDDHINRMGILAFAVLPWDFRKHRNSYSSFNQSSGITALAGEGSAGRRQLLIENSLNQLWGFLFCCAVLCFLFF